MARIVRCAYRDRSDRPRPLGPGTARWPSVQASLGIDRERDPPRPAITIQRAAPADRPNLFCARHRRGSLPVPLLDRRARKRARTPARLARLGRVHRVGGITPVKHGAGPAVKTGNPSLSPRGARSAVGGIRAWAWNPGSRASSSSTVLLVRAFMCPRPNCSYASPPSADSARATGPSLSELAHRGVHKPLGVSVCMRLRRQAPPSRVYG